MDSAKVKAAVAELIDNAEQLKQGGLKKAEALASFDAINKSLFALEESVLETNPKPAKEPKASVQDNVPAPKSRPKKKAKIISAGEKSKFLKDTNVDGDYLKDVMLKKKKGLSEEERVAYTLYSTSEYGKIANRFFEKYTVIITTKFSKELEGFYQSLRASGIKVLSKTYISMALFSAALAFVAVALLASLLYKAPSIAFQAIRGVLFGILAAGITGLVMYFYPSSAAKTRESAIKEDLPFVIINMAAVAGSGAKPISIFKTILSSKEYPGIRDEIKKIVNYVNLFGYDLSTALKAVARRTPSLKFKDLLDGIVNTIESGGDLKEYLNAMADEALTTYRLERQKAVEQIGTYSDIYTTVLIAAPLLFFVTLAIIQTMGGEIGGISVATLATFGTYLVIPILNVGFIIFIDAVQPK